MSSIPFETIANLISLISEFLSQNADPQCTCWFGERREFYVGEVSWQDENTVGKAFAANRQYHLGFILRLSVNDFIRARGRKFPTIDGAEHYYRFSDSNLSRYATGFFSSVHGWVMGKEEPITSQVFWVPARCAEEAIAIFPAPGHSIQVHAVYLYPALCNPGGSGSGGGGSGSGGSGGSGDGGDGGSGDGGNDGFI